MTVTIKDDPKVRSIITLQSNKIAMILAMVGECTCTKKKKHPHGTHAQGTGET